MGIAGALFAFTAVQAVSQIAQGYTQKAENNFNATLYDNQAKTIQAESEIEAGKYDRMKSQYLSKSVVATAGAGLRPTGSSLAVMLDTQTQIEIDKSIGQFNYVQEKNYARSTAAAYRRQGASAVRAGYTNAFSSLLMGAYNYGAYKGAFTSKDMGGGGYSQYGNQYGSNTPKGTFDTGSYSKIYFKG